MADTKHLHSTDPIEGDGINYGGIVWFVVVLIGTALFCELFVWGMFHVMDSRALKNDPARAPLAAAATSPTLTGGGGRILTGTQTEGQVLPVRPGPGLVVDEPMVLKAFRDGEEKALHEYGWIDQNAGTVRLPIERAKDLLLTRGLPVRPDAPAATDSSVAAK
jgi:hypothetical protein